MLSASMSDRVQLDPHRKGLQMKFDWHGEHIVRETELDANFRNTQNVRFLLLSLLISTALVLCARAQACKLAPEAYDLSAYISSDQPNKVVFQAEVESATMDAEAKDGAKVQIIRFKPSRWWLGQARENVGARGMKGSAAGTSCAGMFDFTVKTGEVWLIAGYQKNGVIYPSSHLSRLLPNGRLSADAQKALQAARNGIKSK